MLPLCLLVLVTAQQVPPADELAEVTATATAQDPEDAVYLLPVFMVGVSAASPLLSVALLSVATGAAAIIFAALLVDRMAGCAGMGAGFLCMPIFMVFYSSLGACPYPLLFSLALAPVAGFLGALAVLVAAHRLSNKVAKRIPDARSDVVGGGVILSGLLASATAAVMVAYPLAMVAWVMTALSVCGPSLVGAPSHTTAAQGAFACTGGPVLTAGTWVALNGLGLLGALLAWLSTRDTTADLLTAAVGPASGASRDSGLSKLRPPKAGAGNTRTSGRP
jgi:hypothetical protein